MPSQGLGSTLSSLIGQNFILGPAERSIRPRKESYWERIGLKSQLLFKNWPYVLEIT